MKNKSKAAMEAVVAGSILGLEQLAQGGFGPALVIEEVERIWAQHGAILTEEQLGRLRRLRLASLEAQGEIVA